jgi:hypothetical protein
MVEFTVVFYWWWLWAYLAAGVGLFLPLNWLALGKINQPLPFWQEIRRVARKPVSIIVQVTCWPLAIWELTRRAS